MWLGEVVKFLRFARDVLTEYVANEQAKNDAVKQAAEAARRSAEEVTRREAEATASRRATETAAQEAERRPVREPVAKQPTLKRQKGRRGRQTSVTVPVHTNPELAARMAATPFEAQVPTTPPPTPLRPLAAPPDRLAALMAGLPPMVVETITQLQSLDRAIRGVLTATDGMQAWFERIQAHPRWRLVVAAFSMMLPALIQRFSSGLYFDKLQDAHDHRWTENRARVDRMLDGDWREKVRYILWTNGQRQARALRAAVSAGLLPRVGVPV